MKVFFSNCPTTFEILKPFKKSGVFISTNFNFETRFLAIGVTLSLFFTVGQRAVLEKLDLDIR